MIAPDIAGHINYIIGTHGIPVLYLMSLSVGRKLMIGTIDDWIAGHSSVLYCLV